MSTTARRKAGASTSTVEMNEREARALAHLTMCKQSYVTDIHTKALYNRLVNKGLAKINDAGFWEVTPNGRRLAARVADLRGGKAVSKIAGSQKPGSRKGMAARPHAKTDTSTYSGRLGLAIRKRRETLEIPVADVVTALNAAGFNLKATAVYNWETGVNPIPMNALPTLAKVLKTTVHELLPTK